MNQTAISFREFQKGDYSACETLVANAWAFERHFQPQELAALCKYLYTMGSFAASNFRRVAVDHDRVIGFLFGFNARIPLANQELPGFWANLAILMRLLFMRGMRFRSKLELINSIGTHEKNRTALLERGQSEVVLFVVHPGFQGKGIGTSLFEAFRAHCAMAAVESIIVETNRLEAASFYEHIGFRLKGDFDSPLHRYVTPKGQACLYEYVLEREG